MKGSVYAKLDSDKRRLISNFLNELKVLPMKINPQTLAFVSDETLRKIVSKTRYDLCRCDFCRVIKWILEEAESEGESLL